ncbi:hypothetical protein YASMINEVIRUS_725 [Yasminevirus sp. GU-2018]|uniref:Holliday junction resolvase n=1 Tax=Yasminevirus sp. GU-2018 TaxID=2420051 RepID=A0A5K0U9V5_9VIRU|nr:hypothetical protein YASMINEVIRUS_725 [Yasminevirus sp. GU-2018]
MSKVRRVLSFDVGIVNLAYCILEIDDTENKFKIDGWGIINLADGRKTCEFIKNTGEMCDKVAKHVVKADEYNKQYYCKAHVEKAEFTVRPVNVRWWQIPPDEVEYCSMCKKTGEYYSNHIEGQYCWTHRKKVMTDKKLTCSTKKCTNDISFGLYLARPDCCEEDESYRDFRYELEMGWCSDHYETEYKTYLKKKTKNMPQNSNKISLYNLGASMYKKLDLLPELLKVDEVLVENQPTFINPTMKSVSAMLFSYFVMRGIHEKSSSGSTIKSINFCSPSNKIKVGGEDADHRLENAEDDKVYKVTKELGKRFCKALIDDHPEWLGIIESYKKQDDMADAFLQGFIMNFGPTLPEFYAEKIRKVDTNVYQKEELEVSHEIKCKPDTESPSKQKSKKVSKTVSKSASKSATTKRSTKQSNFNTELADGTVIEADLSDVLEEDDEVTIRIGKIKGSSKKPVVYDSEKKQYYNKGSTAKQMAIKKAIASKNEGSDVKKVVKVQSKTKSKIKKD